MFINFLLPFLFIFLWISFPIYLPFKNGSKYINLFILFKGHYWWKTMDNPIIFLGITKNICKPSPNN